MNAAITISHLTQNFDSPRGQVLALKDISATIYQSEFISLLGPSGCGKSTMLRLCAGLLTPTGGTIAFENWDRTPRRAMVFQDAGLLAWLSIVDNVAFSLETQGVPRPERRAKALALLDHMGLGDFAGHFPHELSGGMRQRAAIARALLTEPDILLMDEPFRALDAQTRFILQEDLLDLWAEKPMLVLFVTHDIEEALLLGDRILVLSGRPGHILADIQVQLPRPRFQNGSSSLELENLRWQIWRMLEPEARQTISLNPDGMPA